MSFLPKSPLPVHLRKSKLAETLPKAELRQLDQVGTVMEIAEGRRIITESTPGRECFVIVDGEFAVDGPGVTATVGGGQVTGELALLTGRQRNASVAATSESTVYVMHPREFATLLSEAPQFCRQVLWSARERLGSQPVTLPAQFVGRKHGPISTRPSWSDRLAEMPPWQSVR